MNDKIKLLTENDSFIEKVKELICRNLESKPAEFDDTFDGDGKHGTVESVELSESINFKDHEFFDEDDLIEHGNLAIGFSINASCMLSYINSEQQENNNEKSGNCEGVLYFDIDLNSIDDSSIEQVIDKIEFQIEFNALPFKEI